jgi:hypothetical protein
MWSGCAQVYDVTMTTVLDGIDGARERAASGLRQARAGDTVSLDDFARGAS